MFQRERERETESLVHHVVMIIPGTKFAAAEFYVIFTLLYSDTAALTASKKLPLTLQHWQRFIDRK